MDDTFLREVGVDLSYANWALRPMPSERQSAARRDLTTTERYDIPSVDLYRAALTLDTRYATLELAYESDRGFSGGHPTSQLLDVLVSLGGVPGLERLVFEYRDLDFRSGTVELVDRGNDEVIQREAFSVTARKGELRYRAGGGVYVFGRYLGYALPRTLYLEEDAPDGALYHQVAGGLLEVDADAWMLGVGYRQPPRDSPWRFGLHLGAGAGPYDINTLSDGQRLDGGTLAAVTGGVSLGYEWRLSDWLSAGVRDEVTLVALEPMGLPDELDRDLRDDGLETERFAIDLGATELLNHLTIYLEVRL